MIAAAIHLACKHPAPTHSSPRSHRLPGTPVQPTLLAWSASCLLGPRSQAQGAQSFLSDLVTDRHAAALVHDVVSADGEFNPLRVGVLRLAGRLLVRARDMHLSKKRPAGGHQQYNTVLLHYNNVISHLHQDQSLRVWVPCNPSQNTNTEDVDKHAPQRHTALFLLVKDRMPPVFRPGC